MSRLIIYRCSLALTLFLAHGCYTSARHVAAIRPACVKADSRITDTYYIAYVALDPAVYDQMAERVVKEREAVLNQARAYYKDWELKGVLSKIRIDEVAKFQRYRLADTEPLRVALEASLQSHYPSLFPENGGKIGLTVAVSYDFRYRNEPSDWSILDWLLVPSFVTKETCWRICIRPGNAFGREAELFAHLRRNGKKFPKPLDVSGGARETEMWESFLLPTGWIPVPGEADWRSTAFLRFAAATPVSSPASVAKTEKAFKYLVFDPDCDGDVLAAAVVKALNRQVRQKADEKLIGGGK